MHASQTLALFFGACGYRVPDAQHRRDIRLRRHQPHDVTALRRIHRAGDIERIVRRAETGQRVAQAQHDVVRERRHSDAAFVRCVRCDFAHATGIRHDGNAAFTQHSGARGDTGGRQQLLDRMHADDAELLADAIEHAVVADQRTGVRGGRLGGHLTRPNLDRDNRLARLQGTRGGTQEALRVAHSFDEQGKRAGVRIVNQMLDEGADVEIGFVAGGNHITQAEVLLIRQFGGEISSRAALRDDGDAGLLRRCMHWRRPRKNAIGEIDQAQAIGSGQTDVVFTRLGQQRRLQRYARRTGLGKPRGQHQRNARAGGGKIIERVENGFGGYHQNAHFNLRPQRHATGAGLAPMHDAAAPVDQMECAGVAAQREVVAHGFRPA